MDEANEDFNESFKQSIYQLMQPTMGKLLDRDSEFQSISGQESILDDQYQTLDLTSEQRKIIEELIHIKNRSSLHYAINCYIAGILDSCKIKDMFDI